MDSTITPANRLAALWNSVWNIGRVEAVDLYVTPHYVRHGKAGDQDKSAVKEAALALRTAFPDLMLRMQDVIEDDDRIAVRWHGTGTHRAPYRGVPATGRTVTVSGTTFVRFERTAIAEEWVVWDDDDITRRLGVIPLGRTATPKEIR
ncbi:MAG TPA: ester cyclase [Aldersonia sp.]